jgi:hypothetical protein
MVNLFEVRKYLCEEIGLMVDAKYDDIRKRAYDIIWRRSSSSYYTNPRSVCVASILYDLIDGYYSLEDKNWIDPEKAHTLEETYYIYRYILDENGRSEAGMTSSVETFNKICSEIGINKIHLRLSGNWSNSANFLDKVIRVLRNSGWIPKDYQNKALILEKEE